ncbi:hypothetical protein CA13_72470 [Planctomycetes bacterium CA13]|uniref:Uncharacterized protein n=1 Tax=Novipirellula herctigrandis TaxID=2527986 RepID=A0A5C5YPK2_9BACT|nr:hypothetical protein CA13_72470 [Planctomycetes bacterium CA13]
MQAPQTKVNSKEGLSGSTNLVFIDKLLDCFPRTGGLIPRISQ